MNAPSFDIKDMLVAESSLALTFATDLFIGKEPTKPDNTVTVFDKPGGAPQLTMNREEAYYYQAVQVRVRNIDYNTGWTLANDILVSLHGRAGELWNGTVYTVIYCSQGPFVLDWDENHRVRFVVSLNLQRR